MSPLSAPILSKLSTELSRDAKYVQVNIYENVDGQFYVQLIDEYMNYTCPDEKFLTDHDALRFVQASIKKDGIDKFIIIPKQLSIKEAAHV